MASDPLITYGHGESSTPSWGMGWVGDALETSSKKASRKLAPNLTRRSHKKSRAGCYTCKTRKIKCGEEKPSCKQCILKSADCVYPSTDIRRENTMSKRSASISSAISGISDTFSLQDMQFFHHFLTLAHPHLPLGNDDVWVREIPQFAQEHCYLMHAMLALGACHMGRISPSSRHESVALMHRGHAIVGLNRALAKSVHAYGEADAMLATCYALTFQSSYMADGMADFMTFVRGCAIATVKIREEGAKTAFDIRPDRHFEIVRPLFQRMQQVSPVLSLEGLEGMNGIQQYLTTRSEIAFHAALCEVLIALQKDMSSAYISFVKIYGVWFDFSHDEFTLFLKPTNLTSQLLLAFFVGIQLLIVPLTAPELPERALIGGSEKALMGIIGWFREIEKRIPENMQHHLTWPRSIANTCLAEISRLPVEGPSVLMLDFKDEASPCY